LLPFVTNTFAPSEGALVAGMAILE
jgi:hypothetical protein